MSRLALLLLLRAAPRVTALIVVLTAIGTISMLFAWMSPSLSAAELALWERLPVDLPVRHASSPQPGCLPIYSAMLRRTGTTSRVGAHPDLVVAEDPGLLLAGARPRAGSVLVDALAATALGLRTGDLVTVEADSFSFDAPVAPVDLPVRLERAHDGIVVVRPGDLPAATPPPTETLCLGGDGADQAGEIAAGIRARQASEGLVSATLVFAVLAGAVWTATLTLALLGINRRRRGLRELLDGLGVAPGPASLAATGELALAGTAAVALSALGALLLRREVLRLWTDPGLLAPSALAFLASVAALWLGSAHIPRRSR